MLQNTFNDVIEPPLLHTTFALNNVVEAVVVVKLVAEVYL